MNHFLRGVCLSGILAAATPAAAQQPWVSRNPVRDAGDAFSSMFDLPPADSAYFFRVNLPGENFITMRFNKLSYWHPGTLREIVDIGRLAHEQLRDSFSGAATAQRIALSIPPANYPVVAAVREHGKDQRIVMLGNSGATPVRIAHDTISIRRNYPAADTDTGNARSVLYSFLLKDLADIETIAADSALIGRLSGTFDSLVTAKRSQWKHQDGPLHSFAAEYNLNPASGIPGLRVTPAMLLLRRFDLFAEFGLTVLSTHTSVAANAKLAYTFPIGDGPGKIYSALSFSGLGYIRQANDVYERHYLNFINLEYGFAFAQGRDGLPLYRTSAGFGYQIDRSSKTPLYDFQYRVFLTYSVSRAVSLAMESYFFRKNDQTRQQRIGAGGLSVLVRIF